MVARDLPMKVKNHPCLLHSGKDLVVRPVVLDPPVRVGGDTPRVALDALDARGARFADFIRRNGRVEVERHEILSFGGEGLERGLVLERALSRGDGRREVRLVAESRQANGEISESDEMIEAVWGTDGCLSINGRRSRQ